MEKRESMTRQELCRAAISKFGKEAQTRKAVEELTELSLALQHSAKGKTSYDNISEEIADVRFMLDQLEIMYDAAGRVEYWSQEKHKRLETIVSHK